MSQCSGERCGGEDKKARSDERAFSGEDVELCDADDGAEFLDGVGGFVEGCLLFGCELDLNDLLEAFGAELARHADVETVDAVLALEVCGAGKDFLFVLEDG